MALLCWFKSKDFHCFNTQRMCAWMYGAITGFETCSLPRPLPFHIIRVKVTFANTINLSSAFVNRVMIVHSSLIVSYTVDLVLLWKSGWFRMALCLKPIYKPSTITWILPWKRKISLPGFVYVNIFLLTCHLST